MFVSPIDVVGDGLDQLSDAGHGEALELPSREFTEEALDEIQPRGGGRGEVELHSRVFLKPCPNSRMLVCGVVVENDVDVEFGKDGPLDLAEESQEFTKPNSPGLLKNACFAIIGRCWKTAQSSMNSSTSPEEWNQAFAA